MLVDKFNESRLFLCYGLIKTTTNVQSLICCTIMVYGACFSSQLFCESCIYITQLVDLSNISWLHLRTKWAVSEMIGALIYCLVDQRRCVDSREHVGSSSSSGQQTLVLVVLDVMVTHSQQIHVVPKVTTLHKEVHDRFLNNRLYNRMYE